MSTRLLAAVLFLCAGCSGPARDVVLTRGEDGRLGLASVPAGSVRPVLTYDDGVIPAGAAACMPPAGDSGAIVTCR